VLGSGREAGLSGSSFYENEMADIRAENFVQNNR
jgi:hypothetical protein